ncbi:MAG: hypothetical protein RI911_703 [Candidatus Parcubacteria bacterium]|jgi:cell division septal protein FtsQ
MKQGQKNSRVVDLRKASPLVKKNSATARLRNGTAQKVTPQKKKKMPLKQRRAYRKRALLYGVSVVMVCAAVGLSMLTFHPSITIQSVVVEGAQTLSAQQIQTAALQALRGEENPFFSRATVMTADLSAVEDELREAFPKIKTVTVSRYGITTIRVALFERIPYATWCSTQETPTCFLLDEDGHAFEIIDGVKLKPALRGGMKENPLAVGSPVLPHVFHQLRSFLEAFREKDMPVAAATISDDGLDARLSFESGPDVVIVFHDDAQSVARLIDTARQTDSFKEKFEHLEYIDARFGNRLYYKSKSVEGVLPDTQSATENQVETQQ